MHPQGPSQQINIIPQNQRIRSLIQQKRMPRLGHIPWVPGRRHRKDKLRHDNRDTSGQRNPRKHIDSAAAITLLP